MNDGVSEYDREREGERDVAGGRADISHSLARRACIGRFDASHQKVVNSSNGLIRRLRRKEWLCRGSRNVCCRCPK